LKQQKEFLELLYNKKRNQENLMPDRNIAKFSVIFVLFSFVFTNLIFLTPVKVGLSFFELNGSQREKEFSYFKVLAREKGIQPDCFKCQRRQFTANQTDKIACRFRDKMFDISFL
jgi:hypothetical protein